MDGLAPGTRYVGPRQELIPVKTRVYYRPLDLRIQNKFSPSIVVTDIHVYPRWMLHSHCPKHIALNARNRN